MKIKLIFPKDFKIKISNLKPSSKIEILEELPPDNSMATPFDISIRETEFSAPTSFGDRLFGFR